MQSDSKSLSTRFLNIAWNFYILKILFNDKIVVIELFFKQYITIYYKTIYDNPKLFTYLKI